MSTAPWAGFRLVNGVDAVVRSSSEEGDDDGAICRGVIVGGADRVWTRGQEDEERQAIQGILRQCQAQEGKEDRAHQGQGWGP